jgi:hypothetical protein
MRSPVLATSARSGLTSVVLPVEVPPATSTLFRSRTEVGGDCGAKCGA